MKALVTGAAGYIGRILCKRLTEEGWEVVGIDQKYPKTFESLDDWFIGSYSDSRPYENQKYDVIFHLGANSLLGPSVKAPLDYFKNNVSEMITMMDHIVKYDSAPAVIFASSAATYGDPCKDVALQEYQAGMPINPYGWSKLMGEHVLEQTCLAHGLKGYSMRFFNVAGAYGDLGQDLDQPHILTKMCMASLNKEKFYINGMQYPTYDGTCVRDYIHVLDVCNALICAAKTIAGDMPTSYTEYNVCSGESWSNLALARYFQSKYSLQIDFNDVRPGDPAFLYGNNSMTVNELNWNLQYDPADIVESHYDYVANKVFGGI